MLRTRLALLLLCLGFVFPVVARGQDETTELTVFAQAYTPGITTGDNPKPLQQFFRLAEAFEKLHPGVKIRFLKQPYGDYRTWMITQCKGETAPDVIWAHASWCNEDARNGWFLNLDPYLARPNPYAPDRRRWKDWFYPDPTNARRAADGHLYTLPIDLVTVGFYYNKEIFRRVGVQPPRTWAEFLRVLGKIKAAGYIPMLMSGDQEMRLSWTRAVLLNELWLNRLPQMDVLPEAEGGYPGVDAREFVRAYKRGLFSPGDPRYAEMLRLLKQWSAYFQPGYLGTHDNRLFRMGKAAVWLDGSWYMTQIDRDPLREFDYGVFHWPRLTRESSPLAPAWKPGQLCPGIGGASSIQYAITNSAMKNGKTELCVDFLRFITAPRNLEPLVYEASMFLPNVKGCKANPLLDPFQTAFTAGYEHFGGEDVLRDPQYGDLFFRTLQGYLGSVVPERAATDRLQRGLEQAVNRQVGEHAADWRFSATWDILPVPSADAAVRDRDPPWVRGVPRSLLLGLLALALLLVLRQPPSVWRDLRRKKHLYLFLLPTFALLALFSYFPIASAFYHSLFRWRGGGEASWVGLNNFRELASDRPLWESTGNMLKLVLFSVLHTITVPLLTAELIFHLRSERLRYLYRVLFVVPMVVPGMVVILLWGFIYDYNLGLLNNLLGSVGLGSLKQAWLGDPKIALYSLMFMGFPWVGGFALLIYYAGLQNIPTEVFEAARVDGAQGWSRFRNVDLPLVAGQMKLLVILTFIGAIQGFQTSLVLTNGGPSYSTMVPGLWLYQNAITFDRMGYACAIGVLLFAAILGLTYLNMTYLASSDEGARPRLTLRGLRRRSPTPAPAQAPAPHKREAAL